MPERADITYFGAGPALLPTDVLETAAAALINFNDTGLGLAEHSHRSQLATDIVNTTKKDLATYLNVPDDYEILFMQGGGSGEFSATVYNMVAVWVERRKQKILKQLGVEDSKQLPENVINELQKAVDEELKIDYLVTGSWSLKASQEAARLVGPEHVNIVADARKVNDGKFGKIPEESSWNLSKNSALVYYCDNETVDGVEYPGFPEVLKPKGDEQDPIVVADMSSNILSRRVPVKNFSVIFFGAQKNLGSTGITVVIIKKSLLPPAVATADPALLRKLGIPNGPVVLQYAAIAKENSLYNTLSIFEYVPLNPSEDNY
jgi:phosphoserine aminotransferase